MNTSSMVVETTGRQSAARQPIWLLSEAVESPPAKHLYAVNRMRLTVDPSTAAGRRREIPSSTGEKSHE